MGKVLKADASSGYALAEWDGTVAAPWRVKFDLLIPAATFTALAAEEETAENAAFDSTSGGVDSLLILGVDDGGSPTTFGAAVDYQVLAPEGLSAFVASPAGSLSAGSWLREIEFAYDASDNVTIKVGGTTLYTYNEFTAEGASLDPLSILRVGAYTNPGESGQIYYIDNVEVYDASDMIVFSDDFESGDFSAWTTTVGDVSIVDDPLIPGPDIGGVLIAFDSGALDDPVTWTRIDNYPGVDITGITIDRGRTDERSKTAPGAASISGVDENGILDPTNATGPFYGKLDPVKQAAILMFNPADESWNYVFRGYIASITNDLDLSENFSNFQIDLVDMLDLINDSEVIPDDASNIVPVESIGDTFYTGQHVDDRILAALADTATAFLGGEWPVSLLQLASGNVFVQGRGYPNQTSLLQVIDEACDAESPYATNRFVTKDGAFAFRGRYYRYVPDYFTAFDGNRRRNHRMLQWKVADVRSWSEGSDMSLCNGLKFQRGKDNLINGADVTPVGINNDNIANQALHDSISVAKYGPRTSGMSLENLITSDADDGNGSVAECKSFGRAIVLNYAYPVTYASELTITNPSSDNDDAFTNTWGILCGIELSDLITLFTHHPGGGGFNGDQYFVEKINYQINPLQGDVWQVVLTVNTTSRSYYSHMPSSWKPPIYQGLNADFTYTGAAIFTDTSTPGPSGPITAWSWNFGDGNTSTDQNPTNIYANGGLYHVRLEINGTGTDGISSISQPVNIPF